MPHSCNNKIFKTIGAVLLSVLFSVGTITTAAAAVASTTAAKTSVDTEATEKTVTTETRDADAATSTYSMSTEVDYWGLDVLGTPCTASLTLDNFTNSDSDLQQIYDLYADCAARWHLDSIEVNLTMSDSLAQSLGDPGKKIQEWAQQAFHRSSQPSVTDYVRMEMWPQIAVGVSQRSENGRTTWSTSSSFVGIATSLEWEKKVRERAQYLVTQGDLAKYNSDLYTDSEKAIAVWDWISDNVTYDYSYVVPDSHTAYNGFYYGETVCQGYAGMSAILLHYLGIETRSVAGMLPTGLHAWNLVQIGDNHWYHWDATSNDNLLYYSKYLLAGGEYGKGDLAQYQGFYAEYPEDLLERHPLSSTRFSSKVTADSIDSGQIGNNLRWTLEKGKLSITGIGEMRDFESADKVPWAKYSGVIKSLSVDKTVTSIGSNAFKNTSVKYADVKDSLPQGIFIGQNAFSDHEGLPPRQTPVATVTAGTDTYPYGSTLVQGAPLTGTFQNDAGEMVVGTLAWDQPNVMLNAGRYQMGWTFTPEDANKYRTVQGKLEIQVTQRELSYTVSGSLDKVYDGTNAVPLRNLEFTLENVPSNEAAALSVDISAASATFPQNTPGTDLAVTITGLRLATSNPAVANLNNYKFKSGEETYSTTATISKATVTAPQMMPIQVTNGSNVTITPLELQDLLPELANGMDYGSVTYALADAEAEVVGTASIQDSKLHYTVDLTDANKTGPISTIIVKVTSSNIADFSLTFTVEASARQTVSGTVRVTSQLTYGDPLSRVSFSSDSAYSFVAGNGARVQGALKWKNPDIIPDAGTYRATWVFTPNDTTQYEPATGVVDVTVNPRNLSILPSGTITKTYDGTTSVSNEAIRGLEYRMAAGTIMDVSNLAIDSSSATVFYDQPNVGTGLRVNIKNLKLVSRDETTKPANFTIPETVMSNSGVITKAAGPVVNGGTLLVKHGQAGTYTYDLSQLLPETVKQQLGTATYTLTSDDLVGTATLHGSTVTYTLTAEQAAVASSIEVLEFVLQSQNYTDISMRLQIVPDQVSTPVLQGEVTLTENAMTYGQTLETALPATEVLQGTFTSPVNETGNVEGVFSWAEPESMPEAGTQEVSWIFTPSDEALGAVTGTVTIEVAKLPIRAEVDGSITKEYDGNTTANLETATFTLVTDIDNTAAALVGLSVDTSAATATYASRDAGAEIPVEISGLAVTAGEGQVRAVNLQNYEFTPTATFMQGEIRKSSLKPLTEVVIESYPGLASDADSMGRVLETPKEMELGKTTVSLSDGSEFAAVSSVNFEGNSVVLEYNFDFTEVTSPGDVAVITATVESQNFQDFSFVIKFVALEPVEAENDVQPSVSEIYYGQKLSSLSFTLIGDETFTVNGKPVIASTQISNPAILDQVLPVGEHQISWYSFLRSKDNNEDLGMAVGQETITVKPLPISAEPAGTIVKTYDGSATASLEGITFALATKQEHVEQSVLEAVTVDAQNAVGNFTQTNVGTNLTVNVSGLELASPNLTPVVSSSYEFSGTATFLGNSIIKASMQDKTGSTLSAQAGTSKTHTIDLAQLVASYIPKPQQWGELQYQISSGNTDPVSARIQNESDQASLEVTVDLSETTENVSVDPVVVTVSSENFADYTITFPIEVADVQAVQGTVTGSLTNLVYGQTLQAMSFELQGEDTFVTASGVQVSGTLELVDESQLTELFTIGQHQINWRFVPSSNQYQVAQGSIQISVQQLPVMVQVVGEIKKAYDGNKDAQVTLQLETDARNVAEGVLDNLVATAKMAQYQQSDAGQNLTVTVSGIELQVKTSSDQSPTENEALLSNYALQTSELQTQTGEITKNTTTFTDSQLEDLVQGYWGYRYLAKATIAKAPSTPMSWGEVNATVTGDTEQVHAVADLDKTDNGIALSLDYDLTQADEQNSAHTNGQITTLQVQVTSTNFADFTITVPVNALQAQNPLYKVTAQNASLYYGQTLQDVGFRLNHNFTSDGDKELSGEFSLVDQTQMEELFQVGKHEISWEFISEDQQITNGLVGTIKAWGAVPIEVQQLPIQAAPADQNQRISKVYDGTATADLENFSFIPVTTIKDVDENILATLEIDATGARGVFTQAGVGENLTVNVQGLSLSNNAGQEVLANYNFADTLTLTGNEITKANVGNTTSTDLTVQNGENREYQLDISGALPQLVDPREYGQLTYQVAAATKGNASIDENGQLTYQIDLSDQADLGLLETLTVTVSSTNYHDFEISVPVKVSGQIVISGSPQIEGTGSGSTEAHLTYGQPLSALRLTGDFTAYIADQIVPVEGTLAWVNPQQVLDAGTHSVQWTFTPTSIDYAAAAGSLQVTVAPVALTVTVDGAALGKTYDGTTAVVQPLANLPFQVSGIVSGQEEFLSLDTSSATATYAAADAGTQEVTIAGLALTSSDLAKAKAANYQLPATVQTQATIEKANPPVVEAQTISVSNGIENTYGPVDLLTLLPELPSGCTWGTSSATLSQQPQVGSVSIESDTNLTYTADLTQATQTGEIARFSIVVMSANYQPVTLEFSAVAENRSQPEVGSVTASGQLTYGQSLAELALTGSFTAVTGQEVPGKLQWENPQLQPSVATQEAVWVFTPDDATAYAPVRGTTRITVQPAPLNVQVSGEFTKAYDGTTRASLAEVVLTLTGAIGNEGQHLSLDRESAQAEFAGTTPGEWDVILSNLQLISSNQALADPANYQLQQPAVQKGTITKAAAPTVTPLLIPVRNGVDNTYGPISLSEQIPSLSAGLQYGTVEYSISQQPSVGTVMLQNGELTYVVDLTEASQVGQIDNFTVTVRTSNYVDFTLPFTIEAADRLQVASTDLTVQGDLTYGQSLSELDLSGSFRSMPDGSLVPGELTWQNPTLLPTVATTQATWVFTPQDQHTYQPVSGTVAIRVNPAQLTLQVEGDFAKTYDGTNAASLDDISFTLTGAVDDEGAYLSVDKSAVVASYASAAPGSWNVSLSNLQLRTADEALADPANYQLYPTYTVIGTINKADAPAARSGQIDVRNQVGQTTYTLDLNTLVPAAPSGEYGELTFQLVGDSVSTNTNDAATASAGDQIIGTALGTFILPQGSTQLQYTTDRSDQNATGTVDQVQIAISSPNYQDMLTSVEVVATDVLVPQEKQPVAASTTQMTYGQSLTSAGISLSGEFVDQQGQMLPGKLQWVYPTEVPDAGKYFASWRFTPEDPSYATVTGALPIEVLQLQLQVQFGGDAIKTYDGTTKVPADHSLTAVLSGSLSGDEVFVQPIWTFASPNAGERQVVVSLSLAGSSAANYVLASTVESVTVPSGITPGVPNILVQFSSVEAGETLADAGVYAVGVLGEPITGVFRWFTDPHFQNEVSEDYVFELANGMVSAATPVTVTETTVSTAATSALTATTPAAAVTSVTSTTTPVSTLVLTPIVLQAPPLTTAATSAAAGANPALTVSPERSRLAVTPETRAVTQTLYYQFLTTVANYTPEIISGAISFTITNNTVMTPGENANAGNSSQNNNPESNPNQSQQGAAQTPATNNSEQGAVRALAITGSEQGAVQTPAVNSSEQGDSRLPALLSTDVSEQNEPATTGSNERTPDLGLLPLVLLALVLLALGWGLKKSKRINRSDITD